MNFLNVILEKINSENKNYIYFLFLFNAGIQILISTMLPLSLSADSYHYLKVADQFNISDFYTKIYPHNRSIGYPFFLYILGSKTIMGITIIVFIQCLMAILTPILIFIFLSSNFWKNQLPIAKIVAFFTSIFPIIHYMPSQIMTETLYIFLLVLSFFYLENFFKKKNIESFFYLIFILLSVALVRPTGVMFFYLMGVVILLMLFLKTINFFKFTYITILFFSAFLIFEIQNTPHAKTFLKFIAFSDHVATKFCKIEDQNKINRIKSNDWAYTPDQTDYLVIKKDKSEMDTREITYIFKEKCLNIDNPGKKTQKYISTVTKLLNKKNEPLRTTLTSTYDIAGSPDKPNPEYNNLTPIEIIKKVHNEYIFQLPFQHIWWRMSANIGLEETNKIISGVILETTMKKPEVWLERYNSVEKNMNPFNFLLVRSISKSGKDMFFWRFIPNPYLEIKKQNAKYYLLSINKRLYLQNIYNLEKLSGKKVEKIYKKDIPVWSEVEKDFFKSYKDLIFEDFNIGLFTSTLLWSFNSILFNIVKLIIILFIPFISIFYFLNKLIKRKRINESDYLAIFFTLFGYIAIIVSISFIWNPRHVMMHFVLFLPAICILLSKDRI